MQSKPQPNQYVYFKTALPLKKTHQGHLSKWLTWPRVTFLNGSALYLQNIVITMGANEVTKLVYRGEAGVDRWAAKTFILTHSN